MIMITGGGGFIGLSQARDLVDRGQKVVLVRRHSFELPSFLAPYLDKQVKIALGDITEPPFLYKTIKDYDVDSIIHAATLQETTGHLYEAIKVNLMGTAEVLEAARIFGLRRVTFISSVAVYMGAKDMRTMQEDNDLPVRSHGWVPATKKAGEQICQLYAQDYKLSIAVIRPPGVWGPLYRSGRNPLQAMIENAVSGKPSDFSHVYGAGRMVYIYVRDCARATSLVHLAPALEHDIYNISDGESHSLEDFARAIRDVIPGAAIKLGTEKPAAGGIHPVEFPPMSIERIKQELGFTPDYDLKRGVRAYITWVRDGKYI